jgi:hypothetical protein
MSNIEKRIIIDDSTERVFQYAGEAEQSVASWSGLLAARDVHRLIDGMFYTNQIYSFTGQSYDDRNIRLEYEADQAALSTQLGNFDLVMTWNYPPDRLSAPRLLLDGDHTYWSLC